MSKYAADEIDKTADSLCSHAGCPKEAHMLRDYARRLRQEDEENRRDPVTDPRPGDRIEYAKPHPPMMFVGGAFMCDETHWAKGRKEALQEGATIIRRREVEQ